MQGEARIKAVFMEFRSNVSYPLGVFVAVRDRRCTFPEPNFNRKFSFTQLPVIKIDLTLFVYATSHVTMRSSHDTQSPNWIIIFRCVMEFLLWNYVTLDGSYK